MTHATTRPERNDPCHCGSGRKYKQCHLEKDEAEARAARAAAAEVSAPEASDAPPAAAETAARSAPPKRPTDQPWKRSQPQAFRRMSSPRKVGGG